MPVTGIEELVVWTPPKELDTTGEKVDVVEHLRFLMGEIINANLPSNGLDIREITDKGKAFYLIMTDGQFPNLDVNIGRLGEESNIRLIMTVVLEEIDLFISHFHFTVIKVYTSFINDDKTVLHEVFTYIVFGNLKSTTNRKIAIHSAASSKSLFCQLCSVGRFTRTRQAKIKIDAGIIRLDRTIDETPEILVIAPLDEVRNIHKNLRSIGEKRGGAFALPRAFFVTRADRTDGTTGPQRYPPAGRR